MLTTRRSGILLHPTSLAGPQPIGSLGQEAYDFVDFLVAAGQSVWQMLPLGPIGYGDCPYSCYSAFAGEPLLISLEQLVKNGDLLEKELPPPAPAGTKSDFASATRTHLPLLKRAFQRFSTGPDIERLQDYAEFCSKQAFWLNDYAFFQAMREQRQGQGWQDWPIELRQRHDSALQEWGIKLHEQIEWHKYLQFAFFEQWFKLKRYANAQGVQIFGDLPIFVAADSADVWTNRHLFFLDDNDQATLVAGVPPDYFSKTGQRWGNPLYRWDRMAENGFSWWRARFIWNLEMFDLIRVDHFRGFSACWAIRADEPTAINGEWMPAAGYQLFTALQNELGDLPIVAEDLGIITADVEKLRDHFKLPGMKILQFAFDSGPTNPYLPHNHLPNSVIYTGTHDNNTTLGWWRSLTVKGQEQVKEYLKRPCRDMPDPLIETALASVANLAIIPLQDLLTLDADSRMNQPGTSTGNWQWRLGRGQLTSEIAVQFRHVSHLYGRVLCIPAETQLG
ncbi:MAG TPA: 4-alpha-glucanotransferase [Malonomonas sp.]